MAETYSIGSIGWGAAHKWTPTYTVSPGGYTISSGAAGFTIPDRVCNSPAAQQQAMQLNTVFTFLGTDGQSYNGVYDAERSIPGRLVVVRRV